jgi:molybdopterin molybdotransferase
MISVAEALEKLFALAPAIEVETVPIRKAGGRVLAQAVEAKLTQPPFAASAMDGYAVFGSGAAPGDRFDVIGEAQAGRGYTGILAKGQAVRIFTGAPVPAGSGVVVIQEDVDRSGDQITIKTSLGGGDNIRPAGGDFLKGTTFAAPRHLKPSEIALLAAMNIAEVPVYRRPEIAIISTGDELVQPGEEPGPDQIIASNAYGLAALIEEQGGVPRLLPIARDDPASLEMVFDLARGADLVVTIGGASVGEYDLVGQVAAERGMDRAFYKVAMRPGKPLMAGRLDGAMMIGLPGNPVSALVCGTVFLVPVMRAMLGLGAAPAPRVRLPLAEPVEANGPREHYMRARITDGAIAPAKRQDSALLSVLASADALLIRPPHDAARAIGEMVEAILL